MTFNANRELRKWIEFEVDRRGTSKAQFLREIILKEMHSHPVEARKDEWRPEGPQDVSELPDPLKLLVDLGDSGKSISRTRIDLG